MIKMSRVTKRYQDFVAVSEMDLEVPGGMVFGFLGPNGAGKTTTIRMLTGILEPDAGEIALFELPFAKHRNEILNRLGYIPDRPFLYGKLTVMELLRFLGSLRKMSGREVTRRGRELLAQFSLAEHENQLVERLSHGMRQKLVFSAALLHDPDLLIVDEPMVGLDPRAAVQVKRLIRELADEGRTVFMSTHTLEVAETLCDRIGIIHNGSLVANETVGELSQRLAGEDRDLESVFMALTRQESGEAVPN